MVQNTRIMLYVTDVKAAAQFWQDKIGAKTLTTIDLPEDFEAPVLEVNPGTEIALFSKAFIAKYSPEVADNQPSLMFFVKDFEAVHDRLEGATPITDDAGTRAFGFPGPDGQYYAIGELTD